MNEMMRLTRDFLFIALLIIGLAANSYGQEGNRYTPPDPYGIGSDALHYTKYMIINPGYLGPNGLPVPGLRKSVNPSKIDLDMKLEYYFQENEQTHDVMIDLTIPISDGKAALEVRYVPFEFYEVSESLSRDRRTVSGEALSGHAFGDVYLGAAFQVIKDHRWIPDILFGFSCKTASGTMIEDARHTDSPGYYFDLSLGKRHFLGQEKKHFLRWYMLGGFYAWQTYLDEFPQNDAIYYGLGLDLDLGKIYCSNSLRGLSGYMFNGDQPLVYYGELGIRQGRAAFTLGYEWGINDYPFECFRFGIKIDGTVE